MLLNIGCNCKKHLFVNMEHSVKPDINGNDSIIVYSVFYEHDLSIVKPDIY